VLAASSTPFLGIGILPGRWWQRRGLHGVWRQRRGYVLAEEERPQRLPGFPAKPLGDPVGEPPEIVHDVFLLLGWRRQPGQAGLRMKRPRHCTSSTMVAILTVNATIASRLMLHVILLAFHSSFRRFHSIPSNRVESSLRRNSRSSQPAKCQRV
jgi:hypothetical protein